MFGYYKYNKFLIITLFLFYRVIDEREVKRKVYE